MAVKKLDNWRIRAVATAIETGQSRARAAEAAGMSKSQFFAHLKVAREARDKSSLEWQLYQAVLRAESRHQRRMLARIEKAGRDPKLWPACAWLLERRYPEEYSHRVSEIVRKVLDDFLLAMRSALPEETFQQVAHAVVKAKSGFRDGAIERSEPRH